MHFLCAQCVCATLWVRCAAGLGLITVGTALPASTPAPRIRLAADEDSSLASPPGNAPPLLPAANVPLVLPIKGMLVSSAKKELPTLVAASGTCNAPAENAALALPGKGPAPSPARKELLADAFTAASGADKETPALRVSRHAYTGALDNTNNNYC